MPRRFRDTGNKGHRTKRVVVRSTFEHVQGTTVRFIEPSALPTGCCHLIRGDKNTVPYPCTKRMTHVEIKIEWRFQPEEKREAPVVKMVGYCKTHRPKRMEGVLLDLPTDIIRAVNGTSQTKAKMRRLENALYVDVVPEGGRRIHSALRSGVTVEKGTNWTESPVTVLCERTLRTAIVPTPKERSDFDVCPKCSSMKEVVSDAEDV